MAEEMIKVATKEELDFASSLLWDMGYDKVSDDYRSVIFIRDGGRIIVRIE